MNALAITFTVGLAYGFAPAYHMKAPTLLRATVGTREAELGVLAPAGYFDPLGAPEASTIPLHERAQVSAKTSTTSYFLAIARAS